MIPGITAGAARGAAPGVTNFIAMPLTYDEADYAGAMTWTRQGNGPHVTPQGFEGDGYEARLKSTTIPTWMQSASAVFTMHASISFYPQKLKSTSELAICAGIDDSNAYAKLNFSARVDVTNSSISQLVLRAGTGGASFIEKNLGRSNWKYQFRIPDVSSGGHVASPQAIVFLDSDTALLSAHFEETFTRIYKIRLSDAAVLGQFDATGDFAHIAVLALRGNGDLWATSSANYACRIDLASSISAGTLVTLDSFSFSGLVSGALDFVTVSGTEYAIVPEYLTTGTPYFYVIPASLFGSTNIAASDRYKRFTGCPIELQGCAMRSGKLMTSSLGKPGTGTSDRYGFIGRFDIVTAVVSTADGGAITAESIADAASKYTEDCAVHPSTNELWTPMEGISSVGSDNGGLSVWSSPVDGSLVENHYTAEYDGSGNTVIKINNRIYDTMPGAVVNDVQVVSVGGAPEASAGISNRFFTGFIRNVVLQDQPMTTAQYTAAVSGDYEPNSLTAYEFTLTNPGAESGSTSGWTVESGGIAVWPAATVGPHSGGYCFYGGASATSISRQRLDVLAQTGLTGTEVDAGGIWAKVRWWQSNYDSLHDSGAMGLRTLNGTPTALVEAYSGLAITPNSTTTVNGHVWYPRAFAANLGTGTRNLDALIKIVRDSGTNNDSYVDDIRVTVYRQ